LSSEDAYQRALRGYRTADRTGKPHLVKFPATGDAVRFHLSDPKHLNSRVIVIPSCVLAATGKSPVAILSETIHE
jgi:hypothetical protein